MQIRMTNITTATLLILLHIVHQQTLAYSQLHEQTIVLVISLRENICSFAAASIGSNLIEMEPVYS